MRPRTGRETGDVSLGRQAGREQGWPQPSWALSHVPHPGGRVDEREADGLTTGLGQRGRQGLRAGGAALSMPPQGGCHRQDPVHLPEGGGCVWLLQAPWPGHPAGCVARSHPVTLPLFPHL